MGLSSAVPGMISPLLGVMSAGSRIASGSRLAGMKTLPPHIPQFPGVRPHTRHLVFLLTAQPPHGSLWIWIVQELLVDIRMGIEAYQRVDEGLHLPHPALLSVLASP